MEYTPEPWKTDLYYIVADVPGGRPGGEVIFMTRYRSSAHDMSNEEYTANARRIVACVNACTGIPTETLENFPVPARRPHE